MRFPHILSKKWGTDYPEQPPGYLNGARRRNIGGHKMASITNTF